MEKLLSLPVSCEQRWSRLLGEAEQAFRDGKAQEALALATEVQLEIKHERKNYPVSSPERRSCTLTLAAVSVALAQYRV